MINYKVNKIINLNLRNEMKMLGEEREAKMWTELITEKGHQSVLERIKQMKGLYGKKRKTVMKEENGRALNTTKEEAEAFRARLNRAFNISKEESENFDK